MADWEEALDGIASYLDEDEGWARNIATIRAHIEGLSPLNYEERCRLRDAEARVTELKHKAEQYDSVVKAVRPADGGRYRADTISRIEALQQRAEAAEARVRELEAVAGYAEHRVDCRHATYAAEACDCGLDAAMLPAVRDGDSRVEAEGK